MTRLQTLARRRRKLRALHDALDDQHIQAIACTPGELSIVKQAQDAGVTTRDHPRAAEFKRRMERARKADSFLHGWTRPTIHKLQARVRALLNKVNDEIDALVDALA